MFGFSIHQLMDITVASTLGAIVSSAAVNTLYKFLCEHVLNALGYIIYPGMVGGGALDLWKKGMQGKGGRREEGKKEVMGLELCLFRSQMTRGG